MRLIHSLRSRLHNVQVQRCLLRGYLLPVPIVHAGHDGVVRQSASSAENAVNLVLLPSKLCKHFLTHTFSSHYTSV